MNGLGVVRSIAKTDRDLPIYAADHSKKATFLSRHLSGNFVLPQVFDAAFIPQMQVVGKQLQEKHGGKSLLCPVNDEYVLLFAKHWPKLEPYFYPMFTTDTKILSSCVDKNLIYVLAEKVGVPYPKTASTLTEFVERGLTFPAVIKPLLRRSPKAIKAGVFRIAFCDSAEEAQEPSQFLENLGEPYVIQQFIPGNDDELYTAGISAAAGKILATYSGRKLRQFPPTTGVAALAETIFEQKVIEYGERLLSEAGYTGIAQVEFKKSNNEFYLMEINPRPWMWNSLATASGINLVGAFLSHAFNLENRGACLAQEQKNGVQWMAVLPDLEHNVLKNRNIGLFRWAVCSATSKCKSYWQLNDPLPGVKSTALCFFRYAEALSKRLFRKT